MLVLNLLLIGLVISLDPIPLTAFILVLASKNGVRKGAGFIFGWLASLAAVIAVTVLVTGNNPPNPIPPPRSRPSPRRSLIGAVLLLIAVRRWRRMGQPKPPKKTPKWQTGIDNMSPWFAMALGPLTQPWGLVAAGVATIVGAKLSHWQDYLAVFLFCLIATASYLTMEIYAGFKPDAGPGLPGAGRGTWIDSHTDQVIVIASARPRLLADRGERLPPRHLTRDRGERIWAAALPATAPSEVSFSP